MKTSLTKLSSSFLLLSLSLSVWARPVAQVVDIKGTVFMVNADGTTKALSMDQHLEDRAEVLVEEGASITLNDYFDSTYHLIGGSHMKFFNRSVQLKKGKTWVQSHSASNVLALTTANGHVNYQKGEFIATFDQMTSKTQILVVNGEVEVSNILDKQMKYSVPAGSFSLVDPEVENGVPRVPTKVGLQSLNSALSEFKALPGKMIEAPAPKREVASVTDEKSEVKKGEIIFITSNRMPASVEPKLVKKYFKKLEKRVEATPVQIRFYGSNYQRTQPVSAPRSPASVKPVAPTAAQNPAKVMNSDIEFTQSLKKQEIEQPKYSKDLQNLIDDLKSY